MELTLGNHVYAPTHFAANFRKPVIRTKSFCKSGKQKNTFASYQETRHTHQLNIELTMGNHVNAPTHFATNFRKPGIRTNYLCNSYQETWHTHQLIMERTMENHVCAPTHKRKSTKHTCYLSMLHNSICN